MAKKNSIIKAELFEIQKPIFKELSKNNITIVTGAAGCSKDFLCLYTAIMKLKNKEVDNIIVTKPILEIGRSMGFLPGDMEEKLDPYKKSFTDIIDTILGKEQRPTTKKLRDKITFEPINFVRGNTFKNAAVILSEAQNCTLHELISFMTRLDKTSTMMLNGDMLQSDIGNKSGLKDLLQVVEKVDGVEKISLGDEFQTRNPMIVKLNKEYVKFKSL